MGMVFVADIGTTVLKAGLVDKNGILVRTVRKTLPQPVAYTADPNDWIKALSEAVAELGERTPDAVILSGNGPTMVPSDGGPALLWMHQDAVAESREVFEKTGVRVDSTFFVPKALYIRNNNRSLYERTRFFLSTPEYVSYKLCGQARTFMCLEGLETLYWNDSMLDALCLDKSKFPQFVKAGETIGRVTPEGCAATGIAQGTPVLSGCPDFMSAIVGSGAMHQGQICDRSGTSQGINLCSRTPSDDSRLLCYRHPNGHDWNVSGVISNSGNAIGFARHLYGSDNFSFPEFYRMLDEKTKPGSGGVVFHPYLSGERAPIWNADARGSFTGISLSSTREDMLRAVCEGICFSMRHVLEAMPAGMTEVRATGGPSESDFINQMKADVTGLKVSVPSHREAGLAGLGIIALDALEGTCDLQKSADNLVRIRRTYLPNAERHETYTASFEKYKKVFEALEKTY